MNSSKKAQREGEANSNSENNSPMKKSSSSFKRRSTNTSHNLNNGKERNELKFIRVAKRSDEVDSNFRKTKTSISEAKEVRSALVSSGKTTDKAGNSDKLLDSIIQSRCLTKEHNRIQSGHLRDYRRDSSKDDYYDSNNAQDSKASTLARKDSRLRKSITSSKERKDGKESAREKEKESKVENTREEQPDDDIDKPWISYLRNLRIPMMCQLHRKITFAISEQALKATPPQSKKRDKSPIAIKKRNLNRNPNCNHNSKLEI